MRTPLTERQNDVFEFIRRCIRDRRMPPTIQEIGAELGLRSPNAVVKLLKALERKGYIEREPRTARGLRIVDTQDPFSLDGGPPTLPLVGRISSSDPASVRMRPVAYFSVDPFFLRPGSSDRSLIGRSADDGMMQEGIRKGDFVVVEQSAWNRLPQGQLAACLVGEELRVRRLYRERQTLRLRASNRTYSEEVFSVRDTGCFVVGPVVSLLRRF